MATNELRDQFAGFERYEVDSTYTGRQDRWVVSLVVGYEDGQEFDTNAFITTPEQACYAALDLTRDGNSGGTQWYVYDRVTGITHCIEQSEAEAEENDIYHTEEEE